MRGEDYLPSTEYVVMLQQDPRITLEVRPFAVGGQASVTHGTLRQPDGNLLPIVAKEDAVSSSTLWKG
jgi:hypothetical protein